MQRTVHAPTLIGSLPVRVGFTTSKHLPVRSGGNNGFLYIPSDSGFQPDTFDAKCRLNTNQSRGLNDGCCHSDAVLTATNIGGLAVFIRKEYLMIHDD